MTNVAGLKLKYIYKEGFLFYFVLLLIVGSFAYMNVLEPLRCDDLIYQFYWLGDRVPELLESVDLSNRIDSINEAFMSQINHYYIMNGRFIIHFLVSCFCGFWGRPFFSVLNVLVYVLFLVGCCRLLEIRSGVNSTAVIGLLWLGLPIQHIFWYSISFAINYLWTSTVLVYFVIYYKTQLQNVNRSTIFQNAVSFVASFIVGTLHEGFSLPLSGSVFLYILSHRQSITVRTICMTLGLWLGTAFVVFAPGTLGRASGSMSGIGISDFMMIKLDVFRYSKRLYLFLVIMVACALASKERTLRFIKDYQIEISFVLLDFMIVLAVPHYSQRIEFPLEMFSLLLAIGLLLKSFVWIRLRRYLCPLIVIMLFIHISFTLYYANLTCSEYKEMLAEYKESPEGRTHYWDYTIPKMFNPYVKRLEKGIERDYISFVYNKEMLIE